MTRIIHNVPIFDNVVNIPEFSKEMLSRPFERWYMFTCREESFYFDDDKRKKTLTVYVHAVSFLVIEYEAFIILVCLNKEERTAKPKSKAWGVYVPKITCASKLLMSMSNDVSRVFSTHFTDVASVGSIFKFNKDSSGLMNYYIQISCLIEAHMQPQSSDRIVSRFPIEFLSGVGISVKSATKRPKYQDFGMPANRLPNEDLIARILRTKNSIEVIGLDIEFSGIDSQLISRNWHEPEERVYKHETASDIWSEKCRIALDVHGELVVK